MEKNAIVTASAAHPKGFVFTIEVDGVPYRYGCFVTHENPTAANIGYANLSDLARACGVEALRDTAELHGIPFAALVRGDRVVPIAPPRPPAPRPTLWQRIKARLPRIYIERP